MRSRSKLNRAGAAASAVAAVALIFMLAAGAHAAEQAKDEGVAPAGDAKKTTGALVKKIRATLPAGWKAEYRVKDAAVLITRDKPVVEDMSRLPNGPATIPGSKSHTEPLAFFIRFGVEPWTLTPAALARYKAENEEISKQLDALQEKMRLIPHKFDDYVAETAEDKKKKQVDAYKQLKATLHVIPDYRYGDISLAYYDPFMMGKYEFKSIVNDAVRKECEGVYRDVTAIFTKY